MSYLMNDVNLYFQEAQKTPRWINTKKIILRHMIFKLRNDKQRETELCEKTVQGWSGW